MVLQKEWTAGLIPLYVFTVRKINSYGTDQVTPFFLMFGKHPISPEVLTLELPPLSLPRASYAKELIKRSIEAQKQFDKIKADLKRAQREYYDMHSRDLHVPEGKRVFVGTFRTNNPYQIVYTLHPLKNPESDFFSALLSIKGHITSS